VVIVVCLVQSPKARAALRGHRRTAPLTAKAGTA
jgi:hypothetical protein